MGEVTGQIEDEIRRWIAEGQFQPGERIPSERELSEQFGAARTTIRLVLTRLVAEGLLEPRHGRGVFVCSAPATSDRTSMTDARDRLFDEVIRLRLEACSPSTRAVASRIVSPRNVSHTTVSLLFNRQRVPQWHLLSAIIRALGGDPGKFFDLWKMAMGQPPSSPSLRVEYFQVAVDVVDIADTCNAYGAQGWELVRILASAATVDMHHLIMRRRRVSVLDATDLDGDDGDAGGGTDV